MKPSVLCLIGLIAGMMLALVGGCSSDGNVTLSVSGGSDVFRSKGKEAREAMDHYVSRGKESHKFQGMRSK